MGLLMADITLIDPTMSEAMRLLDEVSELAYADGGAREYYEDEGADLPA